MRAQCQGGGDSGGGGGGDRDEGDLEHVEEARDEAAVEAMEEGWALLREGLSERLVESGGDAALLSRELFAYVHATVTRRVLPLRVVSPLIAFCGAFCSMPADDPSHAAVLSRRGLN